MCTPIPVDAMASSEDVKTWMEEYYTVAKINFLPFLALALGGSSPEFQFERYSTYGTFYAQLKAMGYDEIADSLLNLLIDDPRDAIVCLNYFGRVLLDSARSSLGKFYGATENVSREVVEVGREIAKNHDSHHEPNSAIYLPYEIGKFLVEKTTLLPQSLHECLLVIDKYKQEDVNRLMNGLQAACITNDLASIGSNADALSSVLESIWKNSRVDSISKVIKAGCTLTLGALGSIATAPNLGFGGVLASAGFYLLDDQASMGFSKKAAEILSPNYLVAVHDFKQKYEPSLVG